jgi:hypothetical protein
MALNIQTKYFFVLKTGQYVPKREPQISSEQPFIEDFSFDSN